MVMQFRDIMNFLNGYESWCEGFDMTFEGIDKNDTASKAFHLCPSPSGKLKTKTSYSNEFLRVATSHDGTKQRIKIVDRAILKCLKL